MKAKLKSGKIIEGRLAKIFVSRGLATQIKQGRPKKAEETTDNEINKVAKQKSQK
jgi:hypothetical protein